MNRGQRGRALRSREVQYKVGAGPFSQLLATIPLQKAQLETERIPKKRSLFAAQVALVHKIITKETSVPEGQALEGAFCVNVRVIRRTTDSVKAAPTAFVQNKAEYNEI
jgi:hypothetical protein